jgi:hypothetical protein
MYSRGCKSLNEFFSEDLSQNEEQSRDSGSVIVEEDDSDIEGDIFL